jgi:hypothetical protein
MAVHMTRVCIYCDQEKPETEFSLEHIFPDRLGGDLCPELFQTRDVCKRCNNTAGLFVDGPFIKSWFQKNDAALSLQSYIDPRSPESISPLMYMGQLLDLSLKDGDVCEMWLGPCGIHYYHVHQRDDPRWDSFTGGDPIARGEDPGRLYMIFTTIQIDWVKLALRSALAHFPRARRYGIGVELRTSPGATEFLIPMDEEAEREAALIVALPQSKNFSPPLNIGFEQRFIAKMALALGYNILGREFLATANARGLRHIMRERDIALRATAGVRGAGYLSEGDKTAEFLGWKGAYAIRILSTGKELALTLQLPSTRAIHIVMCDEPELWSKSDIQQTLGMVFLILPQLGRFVGPISMLQYIGHRSGTSIHSALQDLEKLRVDPTTLPPCR